MLVDNKILMGVGEEPAYLLPDKLNRHGLIAGATGTGKTVTLKVLVEGLSDLGVPTILADVKGDLGSLADVGEANESLDKRLNKLGIDDFRYTNFPIRLWDLYGEKGHPVRITISDMGPLFLARLLDLNDTQEGVLTITFRVADENGLLLLDLKDLRSMLTYVADHAKELSKKYGNISGASVAAIQRRLLQLEEQDGEIFFGEPALDVEDLFRQDEQGRGYANIIAAGELILHPTLYAMFLFWLLTEIYEILPEVGDPDVPKLVFFFDEAHLLFQKDTPYLREKLEQLIRLIRSKGVGIFFVTQNPMDIPESITGQLGNRIQHALRAFTPRDKKAIKDIGDTFRQNPEFDVEEVVTELKTGEALVSFLQEEGSPSVVDRALILPPQSSLGTLDEAHGKRIMENSPFYYKYHESVDRESAYEILQARMEEKQLEAERLKQQEELEKLREEQAKLEEKAEKERLKQLEAEEKRLQKEREKKEKQISRASNQFFGTILRTMGREVARNIFGGLKRK